MFNDVLISCPLFSGLQKLREDFACLFIEFISFARAVLLHTVYCQTLYPDSVTRLPLFQTPLFLLWFFHSPELSLAVLTCFHFSWFPTGSAAFTGPRICNGKSSAPQEGEYIIPYDKLLFENQLRHTHRYELWSLGFLTSMWHYDIIYPVSTINIPSIRKLQGDNMVVNINCTLTVHSRAGSKLTITTQEKNSFVFVDNSLYNFSLLHYSSQKLKSAIRKCKKWDKNMTGNIICY